MSDEAILAGAIVFVVVLLLAVDQWVREIPGVRQIRALLVALAAIIVGLIISRKKDQEPEPLEPEPQPKAFDDEPERQTDAESDDTNLAALATDRAGADEPTVDELRAELNNL